MKRLMDEETSILEIFYMILIYASAEREGLGWVLISDPQHCTPISVCTIQQYNTLKWTVTNSNVNLLHLGPVAVG